MTERKMITVDLDTPDSDNLNTFIKEITAIRDSAPAEYRDKIEIEVLSDDGNYGYLEIEYRRPETDEEYEKRKKLYDYKLVKKEEKEIAELKRLKGKYPFIGEVK